MDFIEILRELMEERGLTQTALASKLNIKQSQVSEWLSGKSKPSYDNLKALAISLNVSADVLLGIEKID